MYYRAKTKEFAYNKRQGPEAQFVQTIVEIIYKWYNTELAAGNNFEEGFYYQIIELNYHVLNREGKLCPRSLKMH